MSPSYPINKLANFLKEIFKEPINTQEVDDIIPSHEQLSGQLRRQAVTTYNIPNLTKLFSLLSGLHKTGIDQHFVTSIHTYSQSHMRADTAARQQINCEVKCSALHGITEQNNLLE